jgi:two-component system, LytTR family, response regulator
MDDRSLRVLIVDDEPVARRGLRRLLERRRDVVVMGECRNGPEAVTAIWEGAPDLVLLDVQMPGLDGFDVLREVGADAMPAVVFVTAFDRYAVRAFEAAAVDYVVKPYSDARIDQAIDRAAQHLAARQARRLNTRLLSALEADRPATNGFLSRVLVRVGKRRVVVDIEDVSVFRADDYCVKFVAAGRAFRIRRSLDDLERRLDPTLFLRVHRSGIVRTGSIRAIERTERGHDVVMHDGTRVPVSRARRAIVRAALGAAPG